MAFRVAGVCAIAGSATSPISTPRKRPGPRRSRKCRQCHTQLARGSNVTNQCPHRIRLLDRAASINRHEIAEAERVRYMERILSYYAPGLTFDVQSLRQAAEELQSKHRGSESDAQSTKVDANELEDLAIDEEGFTIKALPDNTTRECISARVWWLN